MLENKIKISSIVQNQLPTFIREEYPLVYEFLTQYYRSIENQGNVLDLLQNIDYYVKIDNLTNLIDSTSLTTELTGYDTTINVESTSGFPDSYGLLQIDDEIITYTSKTDTTFENCSRGFSGISSYDNPNKSDSLLFSSTESAEHVNGSSVKNLSILFLKEFLKKIKKQIIPGFEDREIYNEVNQNLFIKQSKDFYSSKGTDQSFKILFKVLYGEEVDVIKPRDYLFVPSDAQYRITKDLVVEQIEGNPEDLVNLTLYQDQTDFFNKAYGTINKVEKIIRGEKTYYVISLDYDYSSVSGTIFGSFSIHPKTIVINDTNIGATTLDVDSTVGFPESGNLIAKLENGTEVSVSYKSKSLTQFYDCSGISQNLISGQEIRIDAYAYGYTDVNLENIVKVRVSGVLSDLLINENTKYYRDNNPIVIRTLGKDFNDIRSNNWFFNIPVIYNIKSATLSDSSNFTYTIQTIDDNSFVIGDNAEVFLTDGTTRKSVVTEVFNPKSFAINGQGSINIDQLYKIKKLVSKAYSTNYPNVSNYVTNVQNVYGLLGDPSHYVASSSLPNYFNQTLDVKDGSVTFSGIYSGEELNIGKHNFLTGDAVTYIPGTVGELNIEKGNYFVKRISSTSIKLSRSRSNIYNNIFANVIGTALNAKLEYTKFTGQLLDNQKIIRNISLPENSLTPNETKSGPIGLLVNGVEILNYKSSDSIYYGPIQSIDVLSPGTKYDIINPPVLEVTDINGSGAIGYCEVEGTLEKIEIIDPGFNYISEPIIKITGGNGYGAKAKANLTTFDHEVSFNSSQLSGLVNLSNNTITFPSYHKFNDGEKIVYKIDGGTKIDGLVPDSVYYLSVQDSYTVKVHNSFGNAVAGISTIDLTNYGSGIHRFVSTSPKRKISKIFIEDPGQWYRNRKIVVPSSGISTSLNVINVKNHNYQTGDLIYYTAESTPIENLTSGNSYYVTAINEDKFKLSEVYKPSFVGVGTTTKSDPEFYLKTNQFIDFKSSGSGNHIFNHDPIKISISGVVGISTKVDQDFQAVLQPIFRGEIKSVFLQSGGSGYGSEEILNYNRQPTFNVKSGSGAEVKPIISNGKIVEVVVTNPGSGYNSPPYLEINLSDEILEAGDTGGAVLTPIIKNGSLSEVKVITGGYGYYSGSVSITVKPAGSGCKLQSNTKKWTINLVEKQIQDNQITNDDGTIYEGINPSNGLQYTHLYVPRKLRQITLAKKYVSGEISLVPDLKTSNGKETISDTHSPIIGWAYDGNPIYGPYGYSDKDGGVIKALSSSYKIQLDADRPDINMYPEGLFVEDYKFTAEGDLDEYNGRFCITPEYPNGVYAYFSTINQYFIESFGPFKNFIKPSFPYFIGPRFKSTPIDFNFDPNSNQDDFDLVGNNLLRNTTPYNLLQKNSNYDYIFNPNNIKKQTSVIKYASKGSVKSIGIKTGGFDYKVNDPVIFNNDFSGGSGASAKVALIKGKEIVNINTTSTSVNNVEIVPYKNGNKFIAYCENPHQLFERDIVTINNLNDISLRLDGSYIVGVRSDQLILNVGVNTVGSTGIVTFFDVIGSLNYPNIRENDIFKIDNEQFKILNIDKSQNRIRVLREQNGTIGVAHTASTVIYEKTRKFTFNSSVNDSAYNYTLNKELYFDPNESVGLGTLSGVGIGYTLNFSNPGTGLTSIFIQTRSIFLPEHNLETGTELVYSSNGYSPISVSTDGVSSFQLTDDQILYSVRINNDLIGLSTNRVGLGTNGTFVGINSSVSTSILYFTGLGSGTFHSLRTNYANVITGSVNKNQVTVSTAQTHSLNVEDLVNINCISGLSTTIVIKYNDYNNRILVNPKDFTSPNVNTIENTITISNHGYESGQKVIHTSSSPCGGLENNKIYFVIKIDQDIIKLSDSYYSLSLSNPKVVDITSSSIGTLSLVNPPINAYKDQKIIFDLSDPSLSYLRNITRIPAFDFNLYTDYQLRNSFITSGKNRTFDVVKVGKVGVDSGARVELRITDYLPKELYYSLDPVSNNDIDVNKKNIVIDGENINNNNSILIKDSVYSGLYVISGIGSTTFTYNIAQTPEKSSYSKSEIYELSYSTDSKTEKGPIDRIIVTSGGKYYKTLPETTFVSSNEGDGAITFSESDSIGKISKVKIEDIGFDYPSDLTVRPTAILPQTIKIESFSSFDRIGISSLGINYLYPPNLVVVDGYTKKVVKDVDLRYNLNDKEVTILNNSKGISYIIPYIIPINNSNGISIKSLSFNTTTKDVTVGLGVSYSNASDFPFSVGDKVLIENTSVGIGTTLRGFNSSEYDYALFEVKSVDANIGGENASIVYNLSNYLGTNEELGTFDAVRSSGSILPEKYFPIFDVQLKKNDFYAGEKVSSQSATGFVIEWDGLNELLRVSSPDRFRENETIIGDTSHSQAKIEKVDFYESVYNVNSFSVVEKGWNLESGFLNNNQQRIHDNNYYQYFSYALRSKVDYEKWNSPVSNLNHTVGFKKFSDLIVESRDDQYVGIKTNQESGDFIGLSDLISVIDLECVNDFDLAYENSLKINNKLISDEVVFKSRTIQDYFESVGNRVLIIDDISGEFNDKPRETAYSVVGSFDLTQGRAKKIFAFVRDRRFTRERQISVITLLHNDSIGYLNQYGRVETVNDMGSFDFAVSGDQCQLLFYPTKSATNNFDIGFVNYGLNEAIVGVGTTTLGNIVKIESSNRIVNSGISTSIDLIRIPVTYEASKVLVEIGSVNNTYSEFNEISVIHDGTNVEMIDYGQLVTSLNPSSSSGIGTYSSQILGSDLIIKLYPNAGLGVSFAVNTMSVSIGNTSFTGVGTETFRNSELKSNYVSIASSTSPVATVISQYNNLLQSSSYYLVSVHDLTNNRIQLSEVLVTDNGINSFITEFGTIYTDVNLGDISVDISGNNTNLLFTPNPGIQVEVRVFQNSLGLANPSVTLQNVDLTSGSIRTGSGEYFATFADVKRSFELYHKQLPIFVRDFDGSSSTIVDITENTIKIPNHFYVTGEELNYVHAGYGTTQAIGIATTTITGIGLTNKLPDTVYAIKVDDLNIKLASSSENALKTSPLELDLTSVGIGTSHRFISNNQNSRVLISIDNVIQSPVVSTAITTTLSEDFLTSDDIMSLTGITSIFGGDLLKVNDEIVRVNSVGLGTTANDNYLLVQRSWMGTKLTNHSSGELVVKVSGDYNIIDNTLNFVTSPYGPTPIGSITNSPNDRDWTGITTYSTFSGRSFIRSGIKNTTQDPYSKNYIFDDISSQFTGIKTDFTLKSNGSNISGISSSNAIVLINEIFQTPKKLGSIVNIEGNYSLNESSGITTINFVGLTTIIPSDINSTGLPNGGVIVSIASTKGFGYQPLISAGGTAIVSTSGTIQSISIGNSGSGYRSGLQTVNVGVITSVGTDFIINNIGIASISNGRVVGVSITNPGIGYTTSNPPVVVFDDPLSYSNIPLIYSSSSRSGVGTQATVDIVVGQGSSVVGFELKNLGYGYGQGEILTVSIGGTVGIPTNSSPPFREFNITVEKVQSDTFAGWTVGDLQVLDPLDDLFDGETVSFQLSLDGQPKSIKSKVGSNIDVQATLLVFINDILQVPGLGYVFNGGSFITFTEPPKVGDKSKIIFYKGTGDIDVINVDILETIKKGDQIKLNSDNVSLQENDRTVSQIKSTDTIQTVTYSGPGVTNNQNIIRPVQWCRQRDDIFIDGKAITKDRVIYESNIHPTTNIIKNVSTSSTEIFVESVKTFFDNNHENITNTLKSKIKIINQNSIVAASATAIVSAAGTISSIIINDGGIGYTETPDVTISTPIGLGITQRATATATISIGGTVSNISISNPGTGYTTSNPPVVLIETPNSIIETIEDVGYTGDFGIISGITTISVGVASTGLVFDLLIPQDSFLRDASVVGSAITISGIQTGYYFVVSNSNVGNGFTSLNQDGSTLSIGSSYLDNVYRVASVSIAQTSVAGVGTTHIARVIVSVSSFNNFISIGNSNFLGDYSWGRISTPGRSNPKQFTVYNNGLTGVNTSPTVQRVNPLAYLNYT